MKSIISQITVVCQQGLSSYDLGAKVNDREIAEIKDVSFGDESSFYATYIALDNEGNILKRIENCPCDITYKVVEDFK